MHEIAWCLKPPFRVLYLKEGLVPSLGGQVTDLALIHFDLTGGLFGGELRLPPMIKVFARGAMAAVPDPADRISPGAQGRGRQRRDQFDRQSRRLHRPLPDRPGQVGHGQLHAVPPLAAARPT